MLDTNLIFKLLFIFLTSNTIFANTINFTWKKSYTTNQVISVDDPMGQIRVDLARQINEYLKPRKAINIEASIPKEIPKPVLPPKVVKPTYIKKVVLKQGINNDGSRNKYETKKEFLIRKNTQNELYIKKSEAQKKAYEDAIAKRNAKIEKLSQQYKRDVQKRNAKILKLQKLVSDDIESIKKEQEIKKKNLSKYVNIFIKNSFRTYLGVPYVTTTDYFPDDEIMKATIVSSDQKHSFKNVVEFSVPPSKARLIDSDLKKLEALVSYKISLDKDRLNIEFNSIDLNYDDKIYQAKSSQNKYEHKYLQASIELKDPTNISLEDKQLDLQEESLMVELQKSELKDVTYRVTTNNHNEIIKRLNTLDNAPKDEKKWVFAIGLEKYDNEVPPIAYSKQSAQSFAKVAQKLLGVPKENTFVLLNSKATSGKIKSDFKTMLSLVKKGDTIYFYYSGHGIPVASEKNEPYMLPYDVNPNFINDEKFFKLKNIYNSLSKSKASKIIAVVDSCFSGSTDGASVITGVAAARLKAKKVDAFDHKKMVILSAGRGTQYSNMFKKKEQRLFSYYVMNALLENDKDVNSLYKDVYNNVERQSRKMGNLKLQQPTLIGNKSLSF